jgi:pimeloyl-ACP methyl ester carboxylesterase
MGAMTAVFVHGVPETPAVWRGLLAALDRPDTVALSLPGFDSARPAGFGATMTEYADWLAAQLERLDGPVDLVGHDWGGGFVVRVVSTRPELPQEPALDLASHINRTMTDCILDLYRSAVDVGRQWGPDFAAIPAPGLVIIPSEEPFMRAVSSTRAAARADARTAALDGLGHWWMLQDPARAATVLREFWATLA